MTITDIIFFVLLYIVYLLSEFRIKMMFGSSLPPVVYRRAHVLITLFVFACVLWCPTHIVVCFCFVFLYLVYPMLPISLDCSFLIGRSVFSNVYTRTRCMSMSIPFKQLHQCRQPQMKTKKVHTYIFNINNNKENTPPDSLDNGQENTLGLLNLNDIDYCKSKLKTFVTDSRQKFSVHCCIVE